jgi:hypothetical protein
MVGNTAPYFGPTFQFELLAAGLGKLPIWWTFDSPDIQGNLGALSNTQITALNAAVAAHDPTKKFPSSTIAADANFQSLIGNFMTATPSQIQTYVNNNVTDLASAKALLAKILVIMQVGFTTGFAANMNSPMGN